MAQYRGTISQYTLRVYAPNEPTQYKSVIYVFGDFGLAFLCFVPEGGQLGQNAKRAGQNIFDVFFWMYSWPHIVDMLRNENPVYFFYDDVRNTAGLGPEREPTGEEEARPA